MGARFLTSGRQGWCQLPGHLPACSLGHLGWVPFAHAFASWSARQGAGAARPPGLGHSRAPALHLLETTSPRLRLPLAWPDWQCSSAVPLNKLFGCFTSENERLPQQQCVTPAKGADQSTNLRSKAFSSATAEINYVTNRFLMIFKFFICIIHD